jgi:hypothetical protein
MTSLYSVRYGDDVELIVANSYAQALGLSGAGWGEVRVSKVVDIDVNYMERALLEAYDMRDKGDKPALDAIVDEAQKAGEIREVVEAYGFSSRCVVQTVDGIANLANQFRHTHAALSAADDVAVELYTTVVGREGIFRSTADLLRDVLARVTNKENAE